MRAMSKGSRFAARSQRGSCHSETNDWWAQTLLTTDATPDLPPSRISKVAGRHSTMPFHPDATRPSRQAPYKKIARLPPRLTPQTSSYTAAPACPRPFPLTSPRTQPQERPERWKNLSTSHKFSAHRRRPATKSFSPTMGNGRASVAGALPKHRIRCKLLWACEVLISTGFSRRSGGGGCPW